MITVGNCLGHQRTVLLDTILKSKEDELNAKYSRQFDIADVTVLSSLGSYLGTHGDAILVFINSELNDASTEITREELTVRHLAQYLSFRRWGDMSDEQCLEAMQPALRAMAEKREANPYYVCTIYNEAVYIDKSISNFGSHKDLGKDKKATVEAVTAAITKYGYYAYFGEKNCKLSTLDDYIERAPKDQRGKNGWSLVLVYLLLSLLNTSNFDLIFRCLPPECTIVC